MPPSEVQSYAAKNSLPVCGLEGTLCAYAASSRRSSCRMGHTLSLSSRCWLWGTSTRVSVCCHTTKLLQKHAAHTQEHHRRHALLLRETVQHDGALCSKRCSASQSCRYRKPVLQRLKEGGGQLLFCLMLATGAAGPCLTTT